MQQAPLNALSSVLVTGVGAFRHPGTEGFSFFINSETCQQICLRDTILTIDEIPIESGLSKG
jgi:hypothetical protein